ncbi:unnamed protein product [Toxocara canis]|uniref:Uncharacterized protein n=1 Tax=Toxocara canis TaxID=6265 RepID=A0A183V0X8_TOXCA|nr:unnamed protein product [Toxocara canis]
MTQVEKNVSAQRRDPKSAHKLGGRMQPKPEPTSDSSEAAAASHTSAENLTDTVRSSLVSKIKLDSSSPSCIGASAASDIDEKEVSASLTCVSNP